MPPGSFRSATADSRPRSTARASRPRTRGARGYAPLARRPSVRRRRCRTARDRSNEPPAVRGSVCPERSASGGGRTGSSLLARPCSGSCNTALDPPDVEATPVGVSDPVGKPYFEGRGVQSLSNPASSTRPSTLRNTSRICSSETSSNGPTFPSTSVSGAIYAVEWVESPPSAPRSSTDEPVSDARAAAERLSSGSKS
jgi:hypothetical protein